MDFLTPLSWVAAALGMGTALPQLIRIFRTRVTTGVSTKLWQLGVLSAAAWTAHGMIVDVPAMIYPNFVVLLMQMTVLWLVCHNEQRSFLGALGLPVVGALVMVAADLVGGSAAFGAVAVIAPVAGQMSQLRVMRRAADLQGVSVAYMSLNLSCQSLWAFWGFHAQEIATLMTSLAVALAVMAALTYYVRRRLILAAVSEPVVVRVAA